MQQSWRQLAADMEQQKQLNNPQQLGGTGLTAAQAGLHLAHLVTLTASLLQLWHACAPNRDSLRETSQQPPSELEAAVSAIPFLADVATGIAAIWRSEGKQQQRHAATETAAAVGSSAATLASYDASGAAAQCANAATAAAAYRARWSRRQQAEDQRADQQAVVTSLLAAIRLSRCLTKTMDNNGQTLPGSGAAHDLQWVMLVYTALLVGRLHKQQDGMSPVQLHTQPTSSNQQEPTSSSSSSSAGRSNKGSGKKGKRASRTEQASSSSCSTAASTVAPKQQQVSMVPLHHLQVLEAAGVAPDKLDIGTELSLLTAAGCLPKTIFTVCVLLQTLGQQLLGQQVQSATTALGSHTGSRSPNLTSTITGGSSSTGSNQGPDQSYHISYGHDSPMPSGAAAVLALLAPGSLMWGEVQALQVGAAYPTKKPLAAISVHQVVRGLWDTSLAICIHLPAAAEQAACHAAAQAAAQAAAEQAAAAAVQAAMQRGPKALSAQPSDTGLPGAVEGAIHLPLSQDSWYRSCVELIVPSLLHLRAVGDIDAEHYRSAAEDWFNMLEQLVVLRLNTEDGESLGGGWQSAQEPE